jgi:hypothetical protein
MTLADLGDAALILLCDQHVQMGRIFRHRVPVSRLHRLRR